MEMKDGVTKVSLASLKVMEGWGVDTIYGIPSGTLAPLMEALGEQEETDIEFLQVKHEEVGAKAAVMQWKFGGKLGVCRSEERRVGRECRSRREKSESKE